MPGEGELFRIYRKTDDHDTIAEYSSSNPLAGFQRRESDHSNLIGDDLAAVLYFGERVYRIFWNKELFANASSLGKIVSEPQILALVYLDDYAEPMVFRTQPEKGSTARFEGTWHRDRFVISGIATLQNDRLSLEISPSAELAKYRSLCGGPGQLPPPPQPGPKPPPNQPPQPGPKR